MGTTDSRSLADLILSDFEAMNQSIALAYRDMPMPNRPITDDDEVPGGEDQGEICKPISQVGGD